MRYTRYGKSTAADTSDERTINENQGGKVVVTAKWKGPVLNIERIARLKFPGSPLLDANEIIHHKNARSFPPMAAS
jgi:hypothetical protein